MQARFEDHAGFQRTVLLCTAGAALAAVGALEAGAAGALVVLSAWPGAEVRRRRLLAGVGAALCGAWFFSQEAWLLPVTGALLGLSFALVRREALAPRPAVVAVTVALTAAATLLLPLASALLPLLPRALIGGAYGLWLGLAAAPLHVIIGDDRVEARLSTLCLSLTPDLRALAERAAAARRGALELLPHGARTGLRGAFDSLALAALQVAEQAAELSRSASPALEDDLQRRAAALVQSASKSDDPAAQKSYQRAGEALQGQLDHLHRVRRAKERAVARLHEEVANLERARFSLTLVQDPAAAADLDLLQLAVPSPLDVGPELQLIRER
jgi:hypothetical protein